MIPIGLLVALALWMQPLSSAVVWDFRASYEVASDGTVSFLQVGAIASLMGCAAGWVEDDSGTFSAPDNRRRLEVLGSYTSGLLRFEHQEDGVARIVEYGCPAGISTTPYSGGGVTPAYGSNWYMCCDTGTQIAPVGGAHTGTTSWHARAQDPFFVNSITYFVPYTGRLEYTLYDGASYSCDRTHRTGYWIAGTGPWVIEAGDGGSRVSPDWSCGSGNTWWHTWQDYRTGTLGQLGNYGIWAAQLWVCDASC